MKRRNAPSWGEVRKVSLATIRSSAARTSDSLGPPAGPEPVGVLIALDLRKARARDLLALFRGARRGISWWRPTKSSCPATSRMTRRPSFWQPFGTRPYLGIQWEISIALAAERRGPTSMVMQDVSRLRAVASYRERCCGTLRHRLRVSLWLRWQRDCPGHGGCKWELCDSPSNRQRRCAGGRYFRCRAKPLFHYPYTVRGACGCGSKDTLPKRFSASNCAPNPGPDVQPSASTQKYRIRIISSG
jgi:hypothetical protein